MCLLGCDIGSSSIKVSIVDEETGLTIGADFYPCLLYTSDAADD